MKKLYILFLILVSVLTVRAYDNNKLYFFQGSSGKLGYFDLVEGTDNIYNPVNDSVYVVAMAFNPADGNLYAMDTYGTLYRIDATNNWVVINTYSVLVDVRGLAFSSDGTPYVLDYDGAVGQFIIYVITGAFQNIAQYAAVTSNYDFNALMIDSNNNFYVAGDNIRGSGEILSWNISDNTLTTLVSSSTISNITDATMDKNTNLVLVNTYDGDIYAVDLNFLTVKPVYSTNSASYKNAIAIKALDTYQTVFNVTDVYQNPLENASITLFGDYYSVNVTTDANGQATVDLPQLYFRASVSKTGYLDKSFDITVSEPTTFNVELIKYNVVKFYFVDTNGTPIPNVEFYLYDYALSQSVLHTTDAQGYFETDLPSGLYAITSYTFGYYRFNKTLEVDSDTSVICELVPLYKTHFVITDENGQPIENVKITYKYSTYYTPYQVSTDVNGEATMPTYPGYAQMTITKAGYGYQQIGFTAHPDTTINIVLKSGILLEILTYTTNGIDLLSTDAYINDTMFYSRNTDHTWYLEPGTYKVTLSRTGYITQNIEVDLQNTTVFNVIMLRGGVIEVRNAYIGSNDDMLAKDTRVYLDGQYYGTSGILDITTTLGTHIVSAANDADSVWQEVLLESSKEYVNFGFYKLYNYPVQILSHNGIPVTGATLTLDGQDNMDFTFTSGQNGMIDASIYFGEYYYVLQYQGAVSFGNLTFYPNDYDTTVLYLPLEMSGVDDRSGEFNLYPNPAGNYTKLFAPQGTTVEIYNTNGQLVKKLKTTGQITTIDISDLQAGVYILKLNNNQSINTLRLLKQ